MAAKDILNFIINYLLTIVFVLGVGFFFWFFEPTEIVSMKLYFWSVLPLAILALLLIKAVVTHLQEVKSIHLPRLRTVVQEKYLFEASPIFSSQSFVSLYFSDEHEELIGIGYVETVIQDKGTLQVVVRFAICCPVTSACRPRFGWATRTAAVIWRWPRPLKPAAPTNWSCMLAAK